MYDKTYNGNRTGDGKYYAVRWKAHDAGNELKVFNALDKAKNYDDYYKAIQYMHTPGQNFVFASKSGDIAIVAQGEFPAKWKRQGEFIMPGTDSSYMWQANIPFIENPYDVNPARGFVSSANQAPADTTYPYFLGGDFPIYRGLIINRYLSQMNNITPENMMKMQNDNFNVFAEMAMPVFLKNMDESNLTNEEKKYWDQLKSWNLRNDANEAGATIFSITWESFEEAVWGDEYGMSKLKMIRPDESTLIEAILRDSSFRFIDNIKTEKTETLAEVVTAAFKNAVPRLKDVESEGTLTWAKYKDTRINHLLSLLPFSRLHIPIGGGKNIINATKTDHGPSWRMVVHLTSKTEAYGIYPGGQSGNPGSRYYDNFINDWAAGKYYTLWVMEPGDSKDEKIKWKMNFNKG
jgi:penicillin amidase